MIEITTVPLEGLHTVWPTVEPMLEKAVRRSNGRYEIQDVLAAIMRGNEVLWIALEDEEILGSLTTSIMDYPHRRFLVGHWLGGKQIMKWRHEMLDTLDNWALDNKCDGFEMTGRYGFNKIFEGRGWSQPFVVLEKDYGR